MSAPAATGCELCDQAGGTELWRDERCRVVLVIDPDYAGYCRVIWNAHVAEMTDLNEEDRRYCMHVVFAVERALRDVLHPDKMNLASFGNMTPHVHWHVIARMRNDAHFPQSIWGSREREPSGTLSGDDRRKLQDALVAALGNCLRSATNRPGA